MKLGIMMIFVTDLNVAKQFYCDVLGFRLLSEDANRLEFEHPGPSFVAYKCKTNANVFGFCVRSYVYRQVDQGNAF